MEMFLVLDTLVHGIAVMNRRTPHPDTRLGISASRTDWKRKEPLYYYYSPVKIYMSRKRHKTRIDEVDVIQETT